MSADENLAQPSAATTVTAQKRKRGRRARGKRTDPQNGKSRTARSFPASTFQEALSLASTIQQYAAGQRVRRLTLFDKLGKSPESGPSRQLITNSSKYGLTDGGYQAEHIELTPDGNLATNPEASPRDQLVAKFRLAIEQIPAFKLLYDQYKGGKLPAQAVMRDFLLEKGYKDHEVQECLDTFVLNAKFLGLLRPVAGAERLLSVEHVLEDIPKSVSVDGGRPKLQPKSTSGKPSEEVEDWSKICFYITPIGEPDSEHRLHSNLFLSSIIEPALEEFGLKIVRADQIGKPGMITAQIIGHIIRARLVVADLSFHNPNVFYELSLRHACRLPTVQLIRSCDRIPFDLDQYRTIKIDTSTIYTLVPQLETYKSEIANQVRQALSDPDSADNPISTFCPGLKVTLPTNGAGKQGSALSSQSNLG